MSGQVIADRYNLLETLAQGSFGTTYLAQDTDLPDHSKCIIKKLKPDSNDPKFLKIARRLFEQEAQVLGDLGNHPRIPQLLSYFESDQDFFLVQEFIDGISIAQELSHDKRWPESKVRAFLEECLEILKFVHRLGVIHRDIKPDNLIRRLSDQAVFLLDFGAVKQINRDHSQVVETTIAVGTPGYMPNEQIRGKPHISSDIYALGTIGIYGLTGIRPVEFEWSEEDEILWQHKAAVSPALAQILGKMVRRVRRQRYQSVEAVLADLQQLSQPATIAPSVIWAQANQKTVDLTSGVALPMENHSQTLFPTLSEPLSTTVHQLQDLFIPTPKTTLDGNKTNVQMTRTSEKGTAPVYEASSTNKQQRGLLKVLKVLLPSTVLMGAGVGGLLLWGPNEMGHTIAQLSQLYGQAKYSECIEIGESTLSTQALPEQQLLTPLSKCYLEQANQLAAQNKFGDAVQLIAEVSDQSLYHLQAQQKLNAWSAQLLQDARRDYEVQGNLKQALVRVETIPQKSAVKPQATRAAKQWQEQHKTNQHTINTAKKALKAGQAEDAIATATQIKAPEYWQKIADQVQKEAKAEITNRPAPAIPPVQTATAPTWQSAPAPPVYQFRPRPAAQPAPVYQPPAQPAPPANPPAAPQQEVVNICPGPLCTE